MFRPFVLGCVDPAKSVSCHMYLSPQCAPEPHEATATGGGSSTCIPAAATTIATVTAATGCSAAMVSPAMAATSSQSLVRADLTGVPLISGMKRFFTPEQASAREAAARSRAKAQKREASSSNSIV